MTVRDKVGQLFMIGFQGTDLSGEFLDWLKEYRPGGVILFSRNLVDPFQIARLTNALQEQAPNGPLLIAIDQKLDQAPSPVSDQSHQLTQEVSVA